MSSTPTGILLPTVYNHMTDLAARTVAARNHPAVKYHTAAHTRAKRHHDHILIAPAAAFPHLPERRHIRVIPCLNRNARHLLHNLCCRGNVPAKIGAF